MDIKESQVDALDRRIIAALSADGRATDVALGETVGLSSTAVARRRRLLEEGGLIKGYSVNVDMVQAGLGMTVLVSIELNSQSSEALVAFEDSVRNFDSVTWCCFVSGETDFLMVLHVRSLDDYYKIYRRDFANLPNVAKIRTSFVMREVTKRPSPPSLFSAHGETKLPGSSSLAWRNR